MLLIKILTLVQLVAGVFGISTNVTVEGLGNLIGLRETTKWSKRTIYSFRGIPFALPPVDDLRFMPPVAVTSWNGTLDATEYGSICPQNVGAETPSSSTDEDCLSLNVYVPEVNVENTSLPVMIFIHGGLFMSGYASVYEPHFLLEEDVILVVPQFRLGPLGLLCLQTDEIPGNVQFLDQIMAMQWVQDHIASFGGDPEQVTLFGQSSGAASVNLHQFSPLSKGLFHRVILQSGSAFSPWVMDYNPVQTASRIGLFAGCFQTNLTAQAACFRKVNVQNLLKAFDLYLTLYSLSGLAEMGGHRAVIQTAGTQKFLEQDPSTLITKSEYTQVPIMGGATKHDGGIGVVAYYQGYFNPFGLVNNTKFLKYELMPFVVKALGMTDLTGGIAQTLTNTHFNEKDIGNFIAMIPGLIDICSVFVFKAGIFKMLQANSLLNTTYLYTFGYFGEYKTLDTVGELPFETGVGHADELLYLFPMHDLSDDDTVIAKRMVSLWTSFAITGRPTTDHGLTWAPMTTPSGPYLIIDDKFYYGTNYLSENTIALREGLTAVDKSLGFTVKPKSAMVLATTISLIFKTLQL